jgi:hypothetical protein
VLIPVVPGAGAPPGVDLARLRALVLTSRLELLLLAVGLLVFALAPILDVSSTWEHIDWNGYADSARRWLNGGFLYGSGQLTGPYHPFENGGPGFSYPPAAVLLFVPFVGPGYPAWAIVNAAILATGVIALATREFQRHAPVAAALMLVVLALTRPYIEGLAVGNVNVALAGLFAWAWAFGRGSNALPGVAVAGGIVKPFLGALVFWTDRQHVIVSMLKAIVIAAAVVLVTLPIFGIGPWRDFLTTGRNVQPSCDVSLRAPMCALLPIAGPVTVFVFVAYGVVVSSLAVFARSELLGFAFIVVAMLGAQFEIFNHSFLYAIILGFASASRLATRLADRWSPSPLGSVAAAPREPMGTLEPQGSDGSA